MHGGVVFNPPNLTGIIYILKSKSTEQLNLLFEIPLYIESACIDLRFSWCIADFNNFSEKYLLFFIIAQRRHQE